ncbi:MAG TPA: hypothetical protein VGC54_09625 [Planctomycetota bacterium]
MSKSLLLEIVFVAVVTALVAVGTLKLLDVDLDSAVLGGVVGGVVAAVVGGRRVARSGKPPEDGCA